MATEPSNTVDTYLRTRTYEELSQIILDAVGNNQILAKRLKLEAASFFSAQGAEVRSLDVQNLKRMLAEVLVPDNYVGYRAAHHYSDGVSESLLVLGDLIDAGRNDAAIELSEYAVTLLHQAVELVDDSDGNFRNLMDEVLDMHHRAFTGFLEDLEDGDTEAVNRRRLGTLVFGWEMNNDDGLLDDVFNRYQDILGHEGTAVVGECIERQLAQSPEASMKFAIRNLAERFAEFTGTVDDLISVLAQDLTSPYQYLRIATSLSKANRPTEALEWLNKGMHTHGMDRDSRLVEYAIELHLSAQRNIEARQLAKDAYLPRPSLDGFERVRRVAMATGSWNAEREEMFEPLRDALANPPRPTTETSHSWGFRDAGFSQLAEAYLLDNQHDQAWDAAQQGGATERVWLRLAAARESKHPLDAIPIYLRELESTIGLKKNDAYAKAVRQLTHLKTLYTAASKPDEYKQLITEVRIRHKPKRNLIALLDKAGLR
jgi:hypothetical protein